MSTRLKQIAAGLALTLAVIAGVKTYNQRKKEQKECYKAHYGMCIHHLETNGDPHTTILVCSVVAKESCK